MQTTPANRIAHLDGLRGVAALVVVLGHYGLAFLPLVNANHSLPAWLPKTLPVILDGEFSVLIFFVLSGFVLSQSSDTTKSGLLPTAITRYFRLTIPMLVSLILAWILIHQFRETRIEFQKIAQNPWLTNAFYTTQDPGILKAIKDGIYGVYTTGYSLFDGPTWTMRKELLGSLAVYALYLICPVRFRWWGLALFALVTLVGARYFLGFPLGIFLREMWVRGFIRTSPWGWLTLGAGLLCAWGLQLIAYNNTNLLALAAAGIVFSAMTLPWLQTFLDSAIPQFLGRISFALYLVHLPLVLSVIAWGYLHFDCPMSLKFGLGLVVFLTLAIVLGWLITITIDEPLVRALHRFKKHRLFGSPRASGQGLEAANKA